MPDYEEEIIKLLRKYEHLTFSQIRDKVPRNANGYVPIMFQHAMTNLIQKEKIKKDTYSFYRLT